jgi:hypothetical protein
LHYDCNIKSFRCLSEHEADKKTAHWRYTSNSAKSVLIELSYF